jgi:hypothetical protein
MKIDFPRDPAEDKQNSFEVRNDSTQRFRVECVARFRLVCRCGRSPESDHQSLISMASEAIPAPYYALSCGRLETRVTGDAIGSFSASLRVRNMR